MKICERHVTSPQPLITHSCVLIADNTRSLHTKCVVQISFSRSLVIGFVFIKASHMALLFTQQVNNPQVNKKVGAPRNFTQVGVNTIREK